jgi:hypothetical protein
MRKCFSLGYEPDFFGIKEALHCLNIFYKGRIFCCYLSLCQALWMRRLLNDMSHTKNDRATIFYDNISPIDLFKNHVFQKKIKHIALQFCGSRDHLADIFTNPLGKSVFHFHIQHLGIINADVCNC